MKRIIFSILMIAASFFGFSEDGKIFRFKYSKEDNYRILSTVKENVMLNGRFSHYSEILNRVSVRVTDVDDGGRGFNEGIFMTSESSVGRGGNFSWGEEYESKFWRDSQGVYEISDEYFMPVVRDVPIFPETPVGIGESWTASGHEAHDLGRQFGMNKPFKIPFTVEYTYARDEVIGGKTFCVIEANYEISYASPEPKFMMEDYPAYTMGFSNQTIFWDAEKGQIDHYYEDFRIVIESALGMTLDFQGTAHAEVTDFERAATDENLKDVQNKVSELGLENVTVAQSDKGLTISIENIQFKADSAVLEESEKEKLKMISEILKEYQNDILVAGHTARAGSEASCQQLSEERADSVAEYLIGLGVRDKYHILTIGHGSKIPVASNSTAKGMAKNRRVEITILDK
ncbi:MAG: OmpA family protein [Treponema sp.]|nr:OmpA family protein [Treponema sp.]